MFHYTNALLFVVEQSKKRNAGIIQIIIHNLCVHICIQIFSYFKCKQLNKSPGYHSGIVFGGD